MFLVEINLSYIDGGSAREAVAYVGLFETAEAAKSWARSFRDATEEITGYTEVVSVPSSVSSKIELFSPDKTVGQVFEEMESSMGGFWVRSEE